MKRVDTMESAPSCDLAVLILVLYLIVQMPHGQTSMQNSIYFTTKSLLDPILSSGKGSIEVVQASLLVALYEHGHGMLEAAQVTLAQCGRLGMKVLARKRRMVSSNLQDTEEGRLWWSIFILDRCVYSQPLHRVMTWGALARHLTKSRVTNRILTTIPTDT
jgi:hypothetical protein